MSWGMAVLQKDVMRLKPPYVMMGMMPAHMYAVKMRGFMTLPSGTIPGRFEILADGSLAKGNHECMILRGTTASKGTMFLQVT